jgi:5-(carboxyamino)imidazole ribonucleotide synthase
VPDYDFFSSDFKLGILGGGQLGKMLLTETRRYDINTKVMDPSATAPSRIGSNEFVQGDLTDKDEVVKFGEDCDLITIEIENVSLEGLKALQEKGKMVYPKPQTLELIQNKVTQKNFYREHSIPTAPYFSFSNLEEMNEKMLDSQLDPPYVWKAASGGYDGRGVMVIEGQNDLGSIPDGPGLIEQMISFDREIAVVVARTPSGKMRSYPVVEMEFHPTANLVEFVVSPATLDKRIQNKAVQLAESVVDKLGHVGIMAVEMFVLKTGDVLVNEVAPRVHNSGHLTIEGHAVSQFEQHLRAILDLPLGSVKQVKPAVMINLNGEKNFEGPVYYEGIEKIMDLDGCYVHLYGKGTTRPFRKMGHVTVTHDDPSEAHRLATTVKSTIRVISK